MKTTGEPPVVTDGTKFIPEITGFIFAVAFGVTRTVADPEEHRPDVSHTEKLNGSTSLTCMRKTRPRHKASEAAVYDDSRTRTGVQCTGPYLKAVPKKG